MSDERLRALERRWQETGSDDDEVAYRRECVRTGHLSATNAWELALEGDRAGLTLLGLVPLARPDTWKALARWSSGFGHDRSGCRCGKQLCWGYLDGRPRALVERRLSNAETWTSQASWSKAVCVLVEGGAGFSSRGPLPLPLPFEPRLGVDLYVCDLAFESSIVIPHEPEFGPFALRAPDSTLD